MTNLSTRALVGNGGDILIPGIVVAGTAPKTIRVRAVGPGLSQFGVTGVLTDPRDSLFQGSLLLASNDDWEANPDRAAIDVATTQVGAFALQPRSKDAALLVMLRPGSHTVQVFGVGGATGVALVEIYALEE